MIEIDDGAASLPHATPRRDMLSRLDDALFYALLLGLAFAPFWLGSNRMIAWGVNAVYYAVLALVYEASRLAAGREHAVALRRVAVPAGLCALVACWAMLQSTSLLPAAHHHPIWRMAADALGRSTQGAISLDPDSTVLAVMRFATCAACFWVALQLARSRRRARRLVQAVAIIGFLYALYGVIAFEFFPNNLLWLKKIDYVDSVSSTFVNRNSYATYAALGLICALSLAVHRFTEQRSESLPATRQAAALIAQMTGLGGFWIVVAGGVGVALVMTGSRGGIMATLLGLLAFALLTLLHGRRNAVGAGFALLLTGVTIAAAFFSYGDLFASRLNNQGFISDERVAAFSLTWRSILDAPWFGFGDGAFQSVFPIYRDASISPVGVWDKAHNTYLETLQGLGAPAALMLFTALALLWGRCVHAALSRRASATAPLAASVATVAVGLHALVDFSLQIQAVALTFTALLGAGVAQSWSSKIKTNV